MGCIEAQAQRDLSSNPGSANVLCDLGQVIFYIEYISIDNLLFTAESPRLQWWKKTVAIPNIFTYIHSFNPYKKPLGTVLSLPELVGDVQMVKVTCSRASLRQYWGLSHRCASRVRHWATGLGWFVAS